MIKFIIDEDMPRSTGKLLEEHGYIIRDIRDCGLRGAEDDEVYEFAQKEKAALITGDRGFGNILRFPLGAHFGIVIANFPNEMSTKEINSQLLTILKDIPEDNFEGNLIIIEPGKVRIRRKQK